MPPFRSVPAGLRIFALLLLAAPSTALAVCQGLQFGDPLTSERSSIRTRR